MTKARAASRIATTSTDDVISLSSRASEFHGTLHPIPIKQARTATAVIEATAADGSIIRVVSHSDKYLPSSIRASLKPGEVATPVKLGKGDVPAGSTLYHAEQVGTAGARELGATPNRVGVAGQPVCSGCREAMKNQGVRIETISLYYH